MWTVNGRDGRAAVETMSTDFPESVSWTTEQRRALTFLCVKGIMKDSSDRVRDFKRAVLNQVEAGTMATPAEVAALEQAHDRLMRLTGYEGDKVYASPVEAGVISLEQFCARVEGWSAGTPGSVVFPRDIVPASTTVFRLQKAGVCYMHGPDVVLHYAICKRKHDAGLVTANNHSMVDLTKFLQRHRTAEQLQGHIWTNDGGDSVVFLRKLAQSSFPIVLDLASHIEVFGVEAAEKTVVAQLNTHGPALVAGFRTWDDTRGTFAPFGSKDCSSYIGHGPPISKATHADRGHAMAIVGWRVDREAGTRLLVQNWWAKCQYFEADLEFLASRCVRVAWVKDAPMDWPTDWPQTTSMGGESDFDHLVDEAETTED